jgi:hypothetical protein
LSRGGTVAEQAADWQAIRPAQAVLRDIMGEPYGGSRSDTTVPMDKVMLADAKVEPTAKLGPRR